MRTTSMMLTLAVTGLTFLPFAGAAVAAPGAQAPIVMLPQDPGAANAVAADDPISNIIYLNRCDGGCDIIGTNNSSDARTNMSSIPKTLGVNQVEGWNQSEQMWTDLVSCVRSVYAPYGVDVVTEDPGESVVHHEAIVAGNAEDIGWDSNEAAGVGTVAGNCSAINNGISFVFANQIGNLEFMCAAVAQETAHTYGLDHVLECTDPLTYLSGCGRKYFRNVNAVCGEFENAPRQCGCGGRQNSHVRLNALFGLSDVPMAKPTVEVLSPAPDATVTSGFAVFAQAAEERGISTVELWINGYKWAHEDDFDFAQQGGSYTLNTPASLPDGRLDIEVRAYNDLATVYGTVTMTLHKGADCADAATDCAEGQQCDGEGRCFWEPATAELGEACEYAQACLSGECRANGGGAQACTQECFTGTADACPTGLTCQAESGASVGYCFAGGADDGGCCSTSDESSSGTAARVFVGSFVLFALVWPRRRRRARA